MWRRNSEPPDDLLQAAVRKASSEGADDGIRTHTSLFARTDFKSVASAISPHRPCLAKNTQERPLRPKSFFALAEMLEASVRPQPPSRERRLCLSRRRQVLKNLRPQSQIRLERNDMPNFDHTATKFSAKNALLLAEMCNAVAGR
jgi:hypothetical protein